MARLVKRLANHALQPELREDERIWPMVKVYAVRVGDKYGVEHEEYLKSKLPDITFLRDSEHPFLRQWNKLRFMEIDTDDPICVIDLDIELMNDYMELFEYPLQRGEFVGIPAWWKDTDKPGYELNGGFYKYYPKDCKYIAKKFRSDPGKWSEHYIRNGTTVGPINGEQYFVEDSVRERLSLRLVSQDWVAHGPNFIFHEELKLVHHSHRKDFFYK
jgi:hypothetical protein